MHPINLTRAWIARGVADREAKLARALLHQLVDEGALADAGWACDDDGDGIGQPFTQRRLHLLVHCRELSLDHDRCGWSFRLGRLGPLGRQLFLQLPDSQLRAVELGHQLVHLLRALFALACQVTSDVGHRVGWLRDEHLL